MKKIFTIFTIILLSLFLLGKDLSGKESTTDKYKEEYKRIYFSSLNSKNINEIFDGLKGTIIEIEVKTKKFTKSYRLNTSMINNIEQKLTEKVLEDLIKDKYTQEDIENINFIRRFRTNRAI